MHRYLRKHIHIDAFNTRTEVYTCQQNIVRWCTKSTTRSASTLAVEAEIETESMGAQSHSVSRLTFLVTYFASLIADCLLCGLVASSTERIMRRFIGESTCVSVERLRRSAIYIILYIYLRLLGKL